MSESEKPGNEAPEGEALRGASRKDLKAAADEWLKAAKGAPSNDARGGDGPSDADLDDAAAFEAELGDLGGAGTGGPADEDSAIARLEAELQDTKDRHLRAMADAENIRRRSEKEIKDARAYGVSKLAGDLLAVSDNLQRALDALPEEERGQLSEAGRNLLGGIEMTRKQLQDIFARHGVTPIAAEPGTEFDATLHEAVSRIPSDQPAGTIAALFQDGWRLGNRTLRAAMVAVSAGQAN